MHTTITDDPMKQAGMDWNFLRAQGLELIQRMVGHVWTDYNLHDPGITILEVLCYAITDLSYRLEYDMQELLAVNPNDKNKFKQFFSAKEVLSANPLMISDYKKMLIDLDCVKNAWLSIQDNGLFDVLIDLDVMRNDAVNEARDIDINLIKRKLHVNRNLCEDFKNIIFLEPVYVNIYLEIDVKSTTNIQRLKNKIFCEIEKYISYSIPKYSLEQMLKKGLPNEEIFDGPILEKGFVDNSDMELLDRKTTIHIANVIKIIMKNKEVKNIKNIYFEKQSGNNTEKQKEKWKVSADDVHQALKFDKINSKIKFFKKNIICDDTNINENISESSNSIYTLDADIKIPKCEYRDLASYETIQNEFPINYGIGEKGLPVSASKERKAQAKQLKAYLILFDQILANYFAQLDHFKYIFAVEQNTNKDISVFETYFNQSLPEEAWKQDFPDMYQKRVLLEEQDIAFERKNKILDHLLSVFGEKFLEYRICSNYIGSASETNQQKEEKYLIRKCDFLKNLAQIRMSRNKSFDYYSDYNTESDDDYLKQNRVTLRNMLLYKLALDQNEHLYIVENILLRPDNENIQENSLYKFRLSVVIPHSYNDELKKQLLKILEEEAPAHLIYKVIEVEDEEMEIFKTNYINWMKNLKKGRQNKYRAFILKKIYLSELSNSWIQDMKQDTDEDYKNNIIKTLFPDSCFEKNTLNCLVTDLIVKYKEIEVFDSLNECIKVVNSCLYGKVMQIKIYVVSKQNVWKENVELKKYNIKWEDLNIKFDDSTVFEGEIT
jgi:hypothetical protein